MRLTAPPRDDQHPTLALHHLGTVDRGPWHELWFDLGPHVSPRALVDLVINDDHVVPAFYHRPGRADPTGSARWALRPGRWVVRLRHDEQISAGACSDTTSGNLILALTPVPRTRHRLESQPLPALDTIAQRAELGVERFTEANQTFRILEAYRAAIINTVAKS